MANVAVAARLKGWARKILPADLNHRARGVAFALLPLLYFGRSVACPCCERSFRRFIAYGVHEQDSSQCPSCGSRDRHRLLWFFLRRETAFFREPVRVLHIAPERCYVKRFAERNNLTYLTGDLDSPLASARVDVTNIQHPQGGFDFVICNHVLEHVPDDHKAIQELYRVLRPGGLALLDVPVNYLRADTLEDPNVSDPKQREQLFGQWDHVRVYGRDYPERLRRVGFEVDVRNYRDAFSSEEIARFGLAMAPPLYLCHKPGAS